MCFGARLAQCQHNWHAAASVSRTALDKQSAGAVAHVRSKDTQEQLNFAAIVELDTLRCHAALMT